MNQTDPITAAVLAALETAGGAGADAAAVQEVYGELKRRMAEAFGQDSELMEAVQRLEKRPGSDPRRRELAEEVAESRAADQAEILEQARALLEAAGKVDIEAGGDVCLARGNGISLMLKNCQFNYPPAYAPGPDAASLRRAYLYRQFCLAGVLSLEGIDPKAAGCEADACLSLGEVYTALLTRSGQAELDEARREERERAAKSALDIVNEHAHVVLLGDPGGGKTTFVNFLTWCMAGELLESPAANLELLTRPLPDNKGNDGKKPQSWNHAPLIPIRVILRDFAAQGLADAQGAASDLWSFIEQDLKAAALGDYIPHLLKELREQGGIFLLDGLDEVPEADQRRETLRRVIEDLIRAFGNCRVVLTSRTYAYQKQEWRVPGLREAVLAPFSDGQIRRFIDRWYGHMAQVRKTGTDEAQGRAELLKRAVFTSPRLRELAERPLLLTLMASLHSWRGGSLPENREELYADTVDLLLDRWERPKVVKDRDGRFQLCQPSLMEWLKIDRTRLRKALDELVFQAHARQPELKGAADIPEKELADLLWDLGDKTAANPRELLSFLRERAGLLVPRGVKIYSLPHRTFQEYLAACHLTDTDFPDTVADLARNDPGRWREVCLLAGAKAGRGTASVVWSLAEALCYREPGDGDSTEADIWGALLAGQVLAETADLCKVNERNQTKRDRVKRWLVHIMEESRLPALERVNAGNALSELGDHRFHGPERWYLPNEEDYGFLHISAGSFMMGSDKEVDPRGDSDERPRHRVTHSEFWIGKYPDTVDQYRVFAEATKRELDEDWRRFNRVGNHPVVIVSWHDAVAYCDWLTKQLNADGFEGRIVLPTEAQWERSARGDGSEYRAYPWGPDADVEKMNFMGTGIGDTSPVGCFPGGKTEIDALDMAGNVWEWCEDQWHDNYKRAPTDGTAWVGREDGASRVLRGGAWGDDADSCRAAFRDRSGPGGRIDDRGFRLARLPGQPGR